MRRLTIFLSLMLMLGSISVQAQKSHIEYEFTLQAIDSLDFVHEDVADLNFPDSHEREDVLYNKLASLLQTGKGRVNILHVGDSHVQGDVISNEIRMNLSTALDHKTGHKWGAADRGVIFPFDAMRTNGPLSYKMTSTGTWTRSRCISKDLDAELGLVGGAVMTTNPRSTVSIDLKDDMWAFKRLRVLGQATSASVYPIVILEGDTLQPETPDDGVGYQFTMPHETTTCQVAFCGLTGKEKFTLRGMIPQSDRQGITYTSVGINGATVPAWLKCVHFQKELSILPPDLVIFGLGTNDAYKAVNLFDTNQYKENYRKLIREIKAINPDCTFIFLTNNDVWLNKHSNPNGPRAELAIMELAREVNGGVFNLYQVMGGLGSCEQWYDNGYMASDHVHFKPNGYRLLGDLISNAIINDFMLYNGMTK